MSPSSSEPGPAHSREEIAGYVDGELSPAAQERLEAWIAQDPGILREIERQEKIKNLYASTRPSEPTEAAWQAAAFRSKRRMIVRVEPAHRPALWTSRSAAIAAAAAVLIAALVIGPRPSGQIRDDLPELQVLSPQEVEIVSLDDQDRGALMVGQAPTLENMVAVTPADVQITSAMAGPDGCMPRIVIPKDQQAMPMIVAPLPGSRDGENKKR
jgi:anti-sigma-K factor RskA